MNIEYFTLSEIRAVATFNVRTHYRDLEVLAASIEEDGLQQPLIVYRLPMSDDVYLQSGFRRYRALELLKAFRWPGLRSGTVPIPCVVREYKTHAEAMLSALAVDTTGDPLKMYDIAVRCQYLRTQFPKRDLSAIVGLPKYTIESLCVCLRDLHPKVLKAWEKAPSPDHEIPLARLVRWSRASRATQLKLLAAYRDDDADALSEDGEPILTLTGERADGKKRPAKNDIKKELNRIQRALRNRRNYTSKNIVQRRNAIARMTGIVDALRYALGEAKTIQEEDEG